MPKEEQPAVEETGLDDDLGKVFDEVTAEDQPEETPPTTSEEPKVEETPSETKEEETPQEEVTAQEEAQTEEASEEEVAPPATWTADAKEKFSDLDPVLKDEILKREKDFAQGIQKHADAAKEAESYDQILAPYDAMIKSEGATRQQAVASLLNTAYLLRTATPEQKGQLILQLANQYGADLSQVSPQAEQEDDEYADPEVKGLKDELTSLKNQITTQNQTAQQQQLLAYQQQLTDFAEAKNEDGTLKHEHFDKVRTSMAALMQSGAAPTLEEAYEQSLYTVPEVRDAMILAKVKENEQERIKKETAAAEKAKKAQSVQLKSEEAGVVPGKAETMEEELAAAYDAANAKAS